MSKRLRGSELQARLKPRHLPLLFPLSLLLLVVAVVVLCYTFVTGLFLSQPRGVTFFPFSSASLREQGEEGEMQHTDGLVIEGWT